MEPGLNLARRLADSSIRVKLSLLIALNSSLALSIAGMALFGYESYQQRQSAVREVSAQASVLAESSEAAILFRDEKAAKQILAALRGDPDVIEAVIYDAHNAAFARYDRDSSARDGTPPPPREEGAYFANNELSVYRRIGADNERNGTILLKTANGVYGRMQRYLMIVVVVGLLSLAFALLLSTGMQRSLANPISELSLTARKVSAENDYTVRAHRSTGGEIGILIDSFNHMLAQIETHERARKAAAQSLMESEQRYALAARGANDGLWDWKLTTDEIYFSPRWTQMLGFAEAEHWPGPEEWFKRIHPTDRERVEMEIGSVRKGWKLEFSIEYRMRHKSGSYIWVLTRGMAVKDASGKTVRMAGSQTDITAGKVADPLTVLPNRLYFMDRLESAFEKRKEGGGSFAVLFIDLDKFKRVNDSLGHAAGDELLVGVAMRLRGAVQRDEGTRNRSVVARLGGDEFAVLLEDMATEGSAVSMAEKLLEGLREPFSFDGQQMFASASIGIALSPSAGKPEDLLRNADTAMYCAKTRGKARFALFDERMREEAITRMELETDLRKAVAGNQLVLHYQPQISLVEQRIVGFEALVRWNHPARGLVPPNQFIPVAEESDLICELGRWVLLEACRQMAEWQTTHRCEPPLTISVNVSAKQLSDPRIFEDVREALARPGLAPASLKLELTESSIMENADETLAIFRELQSLGVGLEIDDFGTGYSSLAHLHCLPFETVKIDQSFVRQLGVAAEGLEIVRTILELARTLDKRAIAEGVETINQLEMLRELGCEFAQGYYFSKPQVAEAAGEFLRDHIAAQLQRLSRALLGAKPDRRPGSAVLPGNRFPGYQRSPEKAIS
jgi:diguanylate cyclase (GGDEF)-like protein/PAS domain S-box-containing protein